MTSKRIITLVTVVLCLLATTALAGVKERMIERKPAIDALIAQGTLGENNIGLLEYRGEELDMDLVKEENQDRILVYKAIAKKTGVADWQIVGSRRAAKIADQAPAGTWLQGTDGKWYRK